MSGVVTEWVKPAGATVVPSKTVTAAMNLYYEFYMRSQLKFVAPTVHVSFENEGEGHTVDVHMDVAYKGTNFHLRSIKPEDHVWVYNHLNSQAMVRAKYADGKTPSADATQARVKTLATRFNLAECKDGSPMRGGFMVLDADVDTDAEDRLGICNSGKSGTKGRSEWALLFSAGAWSHKPESLADYLVPEAEKLTKSYSGVATAAACSLAQYERALQAKGVLLDADPVTAVNAVGRIDNPGGWGALTHAGFVPYDVDANDSYGPHLRYQMELKL